MSFSAYFVTSPYPWFFLSGIAFGIALSRFSRRIKREGDRKKALSRKFVMVSLSLSLGIAFVMMGVFIPGANKILNIVVLYTFLGGTAFGFFVFRFKKAVGLPFLLILVIGIIFVLLFVQSITAFTGETEIARVRVLSADGAQMKLELMPVDREAVIIDLEGEYFSPVVKVIIFDDPWVFLGSETWYRFEGMISFRVERNDEGYRLKQGEKDFYFDRPIGISETLYNFVEKYEEHIPGVRSIQIELDSKKVRETETLKKPQEDLESFSIRIQNDGGVQIIRVAAQADRKKKYSYYSQTHHTVQSEYFRKSI